MPSWEQIKAGIFAGESGGDYDALFGFSNRPGGQFAGTKLTDMTVDEAIEFANPRGPYARWVKGQIGRVATPMGGFQVVGTTLRAIKQKMGLSGNERMTPEVQDLIGQAILKEQGTGAWEGYKGPREPTPNATAEPGEYDPRLDTPSSGRSVGSELPGPPHQYSIPRVRHPPNATVGTDAYGKVVADTLADKPKKKSAGLADALMDNPFQMSGGGYQTNLVAPAAPAALAQAGPTSMVNPQQVEQRRAALAAIMARLNSGSLV